MSHGSGVPRLPHVSRHRKSVPPGSDLYEQVLDDLRHDSDLDPHRQSSSSLASPPSSPPPSSSLCERCYSVTAQAELGPRGREAWVHSQGELLGLDEFRSGCPCAGGEWCEGFCSVCSCGASAAGLGKEAEEGQHVWFSVRDCCGCEDGDNSGKQQRPSSCPCRLLGQAGVSRTAPGLDVQQQNQLQRHGGDMGHTSSLLLHKRHKHDYLASEQNFNHHHHHHNHHHHHQRHAPHGHASSSSRGSSLPPSPCLHKDNGKQARPSSSNGVHLSEDVAKTCGQVGRSLSLPAAQMATGGHTVSWSGSSGGCQGRSKFFTNSDDPDDTGSPSGRPHPPLSRLYPRVPAGQAQRQSSPSPNRTGVASRKDARGRPTTGHSASRDGTRRQGGLSAEGVEGSDWSPTPSSASSASAPGRRETPRFPDVHQAVNKVTSGLTRSSPASQRLSEAPGSSCLSPPPSYLPVPSLDRQRRANSPVRLCVYDTEGDVSVSDIIAEDDTLGGFDPFRPRSMSDVSMQMQRQRQMPRLPLLRQNKVEEEEGASGSGEADHAHVHWADEERGSPLATSVLLSSIRPRALSHGSADLPRKPILKKHNGF